MGEEKDEDLELDWEEVFPESTRGEAEERAGKSGVVPAAPDPWAGDGWPDEEPTQRRSYSRLELDLSVIAEEAARRKKNDVA